MIKTKGTGEVLRMVLAGSSAMMAIMAAAPASAQTDSPPQNVATATPAANIVVTASKRAASLDEIDGAVSVRTGAELEQRGINDVSELEKVLPGLMVRSRGNRAYSNLTIRGISSPDFYGPSTVVYVDGVAQSPAFLTQGLMDVQQVELLRGPQGTLYDRNAVGGVINITSKQAREDRFNAEIGLSTRDAEGSVAGTLVLDQDRLFLDAGVRLHRFNGRIDDASTGEQDINWSRSAIGRLALRYRPSDSDFGATLALSGELLKSREEIYLLDSEIANQRYFSALQGLLPLLDRQAGTASLSLDHDLDGAVITSTSALQYVDMVRNISGMAFPETDRTFTQELRVASTGDHALSYVAGVYFLDEKFERGAQGYPGYYGDSTNVLNKTSAAAFGEATLDLSSALSLTAGLRFSYDKASIDFARQAPSGFAFTGEEDYTSVQPKLSLGYQLESGRLYALVARGYKPGGFNQAVTTPADAEAYDPETSWNYEVGGHVAFLDGAARLSAAAYYQEARDKQIYVGPVGVQVLRNMGTSESMGLELELNLQPVKRFGLDASLNWGRSEFKRFIDPFTGIDYSGNRIPYAPDVTGRVQARVDLAQWNDMRLTLIGGTSVTSRVWFDEANSLGQDTTALFDAAIEFAGPAGVSIRVYADNITDKLYREVTFNYRTLGAEDYRSIVPNGRLVGVAVRYGF